MAQDRCSRGEIARYIVLWSIVWPLKNFCQEFWGLIFVQHTRVRLSLSLENTVCLLFCWKNELQLTKMILFNAYTQTYLECSACLHAHVTWPFIAFVSSCHVCWAGAVPAPPRATHSSPHCRSCTHPALAPVLLLVQYLQVAEPRSSGASGVAGVTNWPGSPGQAGIVLLLPGSAARCPARRARGRSGCRRS